ncbi:TonB-dependent receptor [Phenylobacterium sp. LjRoot219]|uniref:TonB-dependent receptor n=1 Tax=Phenylobacterium sp. LjRoot219 TaxID=3342283 RepID=UPI003ED08EF0
MIRFTSLALASASLVALATGAQAAQPTESPPPPAAAPSSATLGEIVVTARRQTESLQQVPQTVNAVTADTLQKLNIRQFGDVQSVVPGLSLRADSTGFQQTASLRGVSFDVTTGAPPTVAFYMNDAPIQLNALFQGLFDVGQIEVLKGPQGTTRGVSAPSGAITVTTRKPNLSEYGGYADVTVTDLQGRNVQGAVNVPLIKDQLGLRVAALLDTNDFSGVRSIHNGIRPSSQTQAVRTSLSYEPSDLLNANVTWQHLENDLTSFTQVSGPGQGTFVNPPITPNDRAAVQDSADEARSRFDIVTLQLDSRLYGQHLSYVGSYKSFHVHSLQEGGNPPAGDVGNILPGIRIGQDILTWSEETTHEIRVASDPNPDRFFDYTVGAFYSWFNPDGHITNPGPLLPGAFGTTPGVVNLAAFNPAYQIPIFIDIPSQRQETSIFGSITLHLGQNTELSGGLRQIWSINKNNTTITTGNGLINKAAVGAPAFVPCSILQGVDIAGNPGDCFVPSASTIADLNTRGSETPTIYNVSLSHRFTPEILVYANTGSAWRPPVASVGLQGELASSTIPGLDTLSFHPSEKSKSYEIGVKTTWMDGRIRANASVFRQDFKNLTIFIPNIIYANTVTTPPSDTVFNMTQSVDARVTGFDIDTAFQIMPEWTLSAQVSYGDGQVKNSLVPCNITDAAGNPVFNTGGLVSLCPGGSSSRLPLWNLTMQTEYTHPVSDGVDGFIRGLLNYYPENKRAEPNFVVDNYALVNLYTGVRSKDGAWEASLFARNVFNEKTTLDIAPVESNINAVLGTTFPQLIRPSGYRLTSVTPRREVGINVRYAFGSR